MTIIVHPALLVLVVAAALAWRFVPRPLPKVQAPPKPTAKVAPRRKFETIPTFTEPRYINGSGYVMVRDPEHPLAGKNGYVREHRKVLHDRIGPGAHPCNWCSTQVEWMTGRLEPGSKTLVADHIDGDKQNNDAANLVPACLPCNATRSAPLVDVKTGQRICNCGELATEVGSRCKDCYREYNRKRKARSRARRRLGAHPGALAFGEDPDMIG